MRSNLRRRSAHLESWFAPAPYCSCKSWQFCSALRTVRHCTSHNTPLPTPEIGIKIDQAAGEAALP